MDDKKTNINDSLFLPGGEGELLPEKRYSSTASSNVISALTLFNPKDLSINDNYTINSRGNVEYPLTGGNILEFTEQANSNALTPATRYLARYLFNKYADTKTRRQHFSIEEYFSLRGLKDTKDSRDNINKQLITLSKCMFWIRSPSRGSMISAQFIVEPVLKNGYVSFAYGDNYIEYVLNNASYTPYFPNILFSLEVRHNYNAFSIGERLAIYKGQNLGRANESRISVTNLLKVTDLPTEEQVKIKYRRDTRNKISTPFINALEVLNNLGGLNSTFLIKIETPEGKLLSFNGERWRVKVRDNFIDYDTTKLYDYQQLRDSMIDFDIVGYPKVKPIEERLVKKKAIERQQSKKK